MNWEIEVCYIIHSDLKTKILYKNVKMIIVQLFPHHPTPYTGTLS